MQTATKNTKRTAGKQPLKILKGQKANSHGGYYSNKTGGKQSRKILKEQKANSRQCYEIFYYESNLSGPFLLY